MIVLVVIGIIILVFIACSIGVIGSILDAATESIRVIKTDFTDLRKAVENYVFNNTPRDTGEMIIDCVRYNSTPKGLELLDDFYVDIDSITVPDGFIPSYDDSFLNYFGEQISYGSLVLNSTCIVTRNDNTAIVLAYVEENDYQIIWDICTPEPVRIYVTKLLYAMSEMVKAEVMSLMGRDLNDLSELDEVNLQNVTLIRKR